MGLKNIKIGITVVWVLLIAIVGIVLGVGSVGGYTLLAAFGVLPPLAMWRLWNEPAPTMSQSIHSGRD